MDREEAPATLVIMMVTFTAEVIEAGISKSGTRRNHRFNADMGQFNIARDFLEDELERRRLPAVMMPTPR